MKGIFYGQSPFSLLECAMHMETYVSYCKNLGFSFVSITDRDLSGHYKHYKLCKKHDIKPLFGLSLSLSALGYQEEEEILLYATDYQGYKNLLQLTTQLERKKSIDPAIFTSLLCVFVLKDEDLSGEKEEQLQTEKIAHWKGIFNNFFLGLSFSSMKKDAVIRIAETSNTKLLPVCRNLYHGSKEPYDILTSLAGKVNNDDQGELPDGDDLNYFLDYFSSFLSTIEIEDFTISAVTKLPSYPNDRNVSSKDFLEQLAILGIRKRIEKKKKDSAKYLARLRHELQVIDKMGFTDYFLIVWDFVRFAKSKGILVGLGRGSAASSLVSYAIGITEIDSIEYGLLFERFLNEERISMPDIDLDFPDNRRFEVIDYIIQKYGEEHVCLIATFGTFQIRAAIRDVAKHYNLKSNHLEALVKDCEVLNSDEMFEKYKNYEEIISVYKTAKMLVDLPRHHSTHPAGLIISDRPLSELIPLRLSTGGYLQSQIDLYDLEDMGLLKIDLLALRDLTVTSKIIDDINAIKPFNINDIPLDDDKTYQLLQKGDTLGIFQLEGKGITEILVQMRVSCIEDFIALIALYRPGPMDNIPTYIARRKGKKFDYLHPALEPYLRDTYGIIVYQEQIIKIASGLGGYTLAQSDLLRKAISKKEQNVLIDEEKHFISRMVQKGFSKEDSVAIYKYILRFANYGFNRAHSVCYAIFAYQMAYLKTHYPLNFLIHTLNKYQGAEEDSSTCISYCMSAGYKILTPDINRSTDVYMLEDDSILIPFTLIKGISASTANKILEERTKGLFLDYRDFVHRMKKDLSEKTNEQLICSGAFDSIETSRKKLYSKVSPTIASFDMHIEDYKEDFQVSTIDELKADELKAFGFNIVYSIFRNYAELIVKYQALAPNEWSLGHGRIIGAIKFLKKHITKTNEEMYFVTIDCDGTTLDAVVFSSDLDNCIKSFDSTGLVLFCGVFNNRNDKLRFVVNSMEAIDA